MEPIRGQFYFLNTPPHLARGCWAMSARHPPMHRHGHQEAPMLDIIYILIGAAFVGVCILYSLACDQL